MTKFSAWCKAHKEAIWTGIIVGALGLCATIVAGNTAYCDGLRLGWRTAPKP